METLIIFYSRTGTTKKIGEEISKNLKADVEEIISFKNYHGIFGYIKASIEAIFKKIPLIKTKKNPFLYDLVIVGTPIWAGTIASPMRTYLTKNKFKKVAFFCTRGGSKVEKTFREMEKLSCKPISTLALKTKEVRNNLYKKQVKEFCDKLK